MQRIPLLLLLSLTVITANGQRDTVRKYLDAHLGFTTKKKVVYNALAIRNGSHWILFAVRPDTSLLVRISFKDEALSILDGNYALYYPGNIPAMEGYFEDNRVEGNWQSWYDNGQLRDSGLVSGTHFTGLWKHWYKNGQLMNMQEYSLYNLRPIILQHFFYNIANVVGYFHLTGILNGSWKSWYTNGVQESTGSYQNDIQVGVWKWFRSDGKPSSVETYTGGKITALECYDEKGEYTGSSCSILKKPVLIHPFMTARDYIIDQLYRGKKKRVYDDDELVTVSIRFTVTKTGTVTGVTVGYPPTFELTRKIYDIFVKMPAWSPAVSHNRAVDYPVTISIVCPKY